MRTKVKVRFSFPWKATQSSIALPVFLLFTVLLSISWTSPETVNSTISESRDTYEIGDISTTMITATFTPPPDVCANEPSTLHSFLGSPTGGAYSGPGVQNIGDGLNFVFHPSQAGVGLHTLTYTVTGCPPVSVQVEVFALPNVTFTAPADIAIDAGIQTGLSGGLPTGGVYSGPGVTDNGNGMTYSFNPATAGGGTKTLTYAYTDGNGCSGSASDDIEVTTAITVTFSAPADLCLNAGVQTGLGGATPTGGVYSGPGVTDDGNGSTYSFNPASAGAGVHTITYDVTVQGQMGSGSDQIEVFALPAVSITAPGDLCEDAPLDGYFGLGSPSGGIYSGDGVVDLMANGFTFDPSVAGVGLHAISYTVTDGSTGCLNTASDNIEVFAKPNVTFTAPGDIAVDAGVQTGLGGGSPTGGVYSGPGVTDDGNGMTYTFDPAAAGGGTKTLTYDYTDINGCSGSASDDITVTSSIATTFTAPADLCLDAGTQTGLGGGTPTGGVYSGPGVTDDGNGMTYSFNPASAGVGTHTLMYTVTDGMGGLGNASDDVEVFSLPTVSFTAPVDMCENEPAAGQGGTQMPSGGVFSGPGVTDLGSGIAYVFDPTEAGTGVHTITYTYTDQSTGCINSASDDIEIFEAPTVSFTALPDLCLLDGVQTGLGGGTPTGGTYSGSGVTDDGNGMTYSFDPLAAGTGTRTITYSVPGNNNCTGEAMDEVVVSSCGGTITWDGSESSDWNTPGNWDGNQVPTADDDVVIPQVATNNPVITGGVEGQAQSLNISANGNLTIANNGSLTVSNEADSIVVDVTGLLTVATGGVLNASIAAP